MWIEGPDATCSRRLSRWTGRLVDLRGGGQSHCAPSSPAPCPLGQLPARSRYVSRELCFHSDFRARAAPFRLCLRHDPAQVLLSSLWVASTARRDEKKKLCSCSPGIPNPTQSRIHGSYSHSSCPSLGIAVSCRGQPRPKHATPESQPAQPLVAAAPPLATSDGPEGHHHIHDLEGSARRSAAGRPCGAVRCGAAESRKITPRRLTLGRHLGVAHLLRR